MPIFILCILSIPIGMPVLMFYTYIALGNQLDPAKAFTTLSYFGLVMNPIMLIPTFLQQLLLALMSMERVQNFLDAEELPVYVIKDSAATPLLGGQDNIVICMDKANLSWLTKENVEEETKAAQEAAAALLKKEEIKNKNKQGASTAPIVGAVAASAPQEGQGGGELELAEVSVSEGCGAQENGQTPLTADPLVATSIASPSPAATTVNVNRSIMTLRNISIFYYYSSSSRRRVRVRQRRRQTQGQH